MEVSVLNSATILCLAAALLVLEWLSPWRRSAPEIQFRWLTNISLMLLGGIVVAIFLPSDVIAVAADLQGGWIQQWQLTPAWELALVFLLLDGWRYWEHRVLHEVPLLWRAHMVHHSDTSLDITTGQRHHPLESVLATCTLLLLVFALGFSAQALAIYIGVATLSALWSHANFDLPDSIDRSLRLWLVTPAVHAVHHSSFQPETDSNYGSVLTIWDRLFGTYTDPADARIPHYGLDYFHHPEDRALAPVLLQPFEYRGGMAYPERVSNDEETASTPVTLSREWRIALWQASAGLVLSMVALWPTALGLTRVWGNSEAYQYAWLVLPMFVYTAGWYHRDRILRMVPRPDGLGLAVILCAIVAWCAARAVDIQLGQHLALVLVLQGIALCTLGRTVYRQLFPIMAMLFLLVPSGDVLQPLLRQLTLKWMEWFTVAFGLPHEVDGFMIYVGEHRYVVIDLCSGLTFVNLAGFLGYSFGVLLFRSFGKILALAAVGAALGVFTNALRVWLIVGLDWLQGTQMDMAGHMDLQWLALVIALGLLFYFTARLARHGDLPREEVPMVAGKSVWRATRFAPLLAGIMVVVVIVPVQRLTANTSNRSTGVLTRIAELYPDSSWLDEGAKSGAALLIPYTRDLDIVIAEPEGGRDSVDASRVSPEAPNIWRHTQAVRHLDCHRGTCIRFVHNTWRRRGSEDARHALYAYFVGESVTDSELFYRLASGWNRLRGSGANAGLIGFKVRGELPAEHVLAEIFQQILAETTSAQKYVHNGGFDAEIPPAPAPPIVLRASRIAMDGEG